MNRMPKYTPWLNLLGLISLIPFAGVIVWVVVLADAPGGDPIGAAFLLGIVWLFFGVILVAQRISGRRQR